MREYFHYDDELLLISINRYRLQFCEINNITNFTKIPYTKRLLLTSNNAL